MIHDQRFGIGVIALTLTLAALIGIGGWRGPRMAKAVESGSVNVKAERHEEIGKDHGRIVAAVCLMEGFSSLEPPLHISTSPVKKGYEVVIAQETPAGDARRKGIARVVFSEAGARITRDAFVADYAQKRSDRLDHDLAAALAYLDAEWRLPHEFALDWKREADKTVVVVTRTPRSPGGHIMATVNRDGVGINPGS